MNKPSQVDILSSNPAAMDHQDYKEVLPERLDDNDKHDDYGNFDEGSSSADEEHDKLSSIHNFRSGNRHVAEPSTNPTGSIRRTDSWTSFITRSERNILMGKDKPPTDAEASTRKVKFVHDEELETVHEVEAVPEEIKPQYWMSGSDFDRLDKEVSLTKFRWENHKSGKIKFDEEANSLRGLEHVIEVDSDKNLKRWKHIRTVLGEINRQRETNPVAKIDWEKVRQASLTSSKVFYEHAVAMGKKDEEAKERAWNRKPTAPVMKPSETPGKQKDAAKRRGLMFWKK